MPHVCQDVGQGRDRNYSTNDGRLGVFFLGWIRIYLLAGGYGVDSTASRCEVL